LAFASLPFIESVLSRAAVRILGFILAGAAFAAAATLIVSYELHVKFAVEALAAANLDGVTAFCVFLVLCGSGIAYSALRAPLAAWPMTLGSLAIVFSYFIAPAMNGERSGADFVRSVLTQIEPGEQLALVAYKEQFLLYLDRPTVNFGHRRGFEGPQESYDAAAWLDAAANRVLLVPSEILKNDDTSQCFVANSAKAGVSSSEEWYLVRAPAAQSCAAKGAASRAILYDPKVR
jgi:hypothetical protein